MARSRAPHPVLSLFNPAVQQWFEDSFGVPTEAQMRGWPAIANRDSTLLVAPTGSGKTLAAFLHSLDRLMFTPAPDPAERCRVLYVSPLKALAVDVERNLRAPLAGITEVAHARGDTHQVPEVAVRTGDTPAGERARFSRRPSDILITTPESLYLLLTSQAREKLRTVDTVIVDEVHALVGTKRGAHLMLSLERLEARALRPIQRVGLSATVRPIEEVAQFLVGAEPRARRPRGARVEPARVPDPEAQFVEAEEGLRYRPVTCVDAGAKRPLELTIEVPVEDMARLGKPVEPQSGASAQGPVRTSIWTAIHPRLLALVQAHTSTLIFVNSRRVAERLSAALNELAGETLVLAHHGSIARAQRLEIEDRLKAGKVRGLVATSSLELGIDMGAIDLVVQIEAPPTVASALQRIGRAGHRAGAVSRGVLFPKYRGDLLACAALAEAMEQGEVESQRYPRNPLDVLAQQIVAMASLEAWNVDALYERVRQAAPYAELRRSIFDGVLDMLSGRYPSDDFAELKPRIVWDRLSDTVSGREGAQRIAIVNGGTIPDRGLYGVFLAGAKDTRSGRVGELDEEMVFESRPGETFLLGASTWRIEEITHDRVLVSPAPGEPGKMPFWRGETAGRPLELGRRIGALVRELRALSPDAARERLERVHHLDRRAADNLLQYLAEQAEATEHVPDDRTLVVERIRDELGDWRVCVLSPLGGRVHAPWAMAAIGRIRDETGVEAEAMWTDDGFVLRFPETEAPPDVALLFPSPSQLESLVLRQLGGTALFAAKFREVAGRALLLPRRSPGKRTPLWRQRKRASDLLAAAAQFGSFPMLLEAYRECLRDEFDLPALHEVLQAVGARRIRVHTVDARTPSPFASGLLFGFVANYLYEGDTPRAERRAQALAIDQTQLRELLGEAELRELLDSDVLFDLEQELQWLLPRQRVHGKDGVHDLLRRFGDLSRDELLRRGEPDEVQEALEALVATRRAVPLQLRGETRYIAVEDAARYRDALGASLPPGLPEALLGSVADALGDVVCRYARTHGPFAAGELSRRHGLPLDTVSVVLHRLGAAGKLVQGAFRPGGRGLEWCDPDVLSTLRRRSLAKLRSEVEPVEPAVLGRFAISWHGLLRRRPGLDALLDVVEKLQGLALPASILETEILPARVEGYRPADLDALASAGEIAWVGASPMGERDGRLALFLTDALRRLWRPSLDTEPLDDRQQRILDGLQSQGASFFAAIHAAAGGGLPQETVDALWSLVWRGRVTNDAFRSLRAFLRGASARDRRAARPFRSRRALPPAAEGRWSLVEERAQPRPAPTEQATALAEQLLARYGLVTREVAALEELPGGFGAVYPVLQQLEERGRIRRGYFVAGVGALQFGLPPVLEQLRSLRTLPEQAEAVALSAVDPANPYGALLPWPEREAGRSPARAAGAWVVIVDGALVLYLFRGGRQLLTFLPESEPERSRRADAASRALVALARAREGRREGLLISEVDGLRAAEHPIASHLVDAGFAASALGFHLLRRPLDVTSPRESLLRGEPDA